MEYMYKLLNFYKIKGSAMNVNFKDKMVLAKDLDGVEFYMKYDKVSST